MTSPLALSTSWAVSTPPPGPPLPVPPPDDDGPVPCSVSVRLLPNTKNEENCLQAHPARQEVHFFPPPIDPSSPSSPLGSPPSPQVHNFEHVFGESATQEAVYQAAVQPLVKLVLLGYDLSVLAYGPSDGGKTHTLTGPAADSYAMSEKDFGVVHRTARDIFAALQSEEQRQFSVKVSFVEVDNDKATDLLISEGTNEVQLKDPATGAFLCTPIDWRTRFASVDCFSVNDVTVLYKQGLTMLSSHGGYNNLELETSLESCFLTGPTTHSIFRIDVVQTTADGSTVSSSVMFSDLAGSDKLQTNSAFGRVLNHGLFQLNSVVSALGMRNEISTPLVDTCLLTNLLRDSFGGSSLTVLLCCLPTVARRAEEVKLAIDFASLVANIQNFPSCNVTRAEASSPAEDGSNVSTLRRDSDASSIHHRSASVVHGNMPPTAEESPPTRNAFVISPPRIGSTPPAHILQPMPALAIPQMQSPPLQGMMSPQQQINELQAVINTAALSPPIPPGSPLASALLAVQVQQQLLLQQQHQQQILLQQQQQEMFNTYPHFQQTGQQLPPSTCASFPSPVTRPAAGGLLAPLSVPVLPTFNQNSSANNMNVNNNIAQQQQQQPNNNNSSGNRRCSIRNLNLDIINEESNEGSSSVRSSCSVPQKSEGTKSSKRDEEENDENIEVAEESGFSFSSSAGAGESSDEEDFDSEDSEISFDEEEEEAERRLFEQQQAAEAAAPKIDVFEETRRLLPKFYEDTERMLQELVQSELSKSDQQCSKARNSLATMAVQAASELERKMQARFEREEKVLVAGLKALDMSGTATYTCKAIRKLKTGVLTQRAAAEQRSINEIRDDQNHPEWEQNAVLRASLDEQLALFDAVIEYKNEVATGKAMDYIGGQSDDTAPDELKFLQGLSKDDCRALVHRLFLRVVDLRGQQVAQDMEVIKFEDRFSKMNVAAKYYNNQLLTKLKQNDQSARTAAKESKRMEAELRKRIETLEAKYKDKKRREVEMQKNYDKLEKKYTYYRCFYNEHINMDCQNCNHRVHNVGGVDATTDSGGGDRVPSSSRLQQSTSGMKATTTVAGSGKDQKVKLHLSGAKKK